MLAVEMASTIPNYQDTDAIFYRLNMDACVCLRVKMHLDLYIRVTKVELFAIFNKIYFRRLKMSTRQITRAKITKAFIKFRKLILVMYCIRMFLDYPFFGIYLVASI